MHRCLQLAKLGAGHVAPNPMVGAVLLYDDRIIGEGWHKEYGGPHAEVSCIKSVAEKDKAFISQSTLYVSLEPCAHFGKTPPCTNLIIQNKIPKVIIGCRDPFKVVDAGQNDEAGQGNGIEKLKAAGVQVETGILEDECKELNKRFFIFNTQHRPYVILKWAQTRDGYIAPLNPPQGKASPNPSQGGALESSKEEESFILSGSKVPPCGGFRGARLFISNEYSNRLVHQWRSEEAAILVGTNTAMQDNPELTTRLWPGRSPVRLVVDMNLKLPGSLQLFNDKSPTIIFNTIKHSDSFGDLAPSPFMERVGSDDKCQTQTIASEVRYYQVSNDVNLVHQILHALYQLKIQSVLVEGGARLLQSFIDEGIWDEARIINNEELIVNNGLHAPLLTGIAKASEQKILNDRIEIYKPDF